jgi:FixJ family two-component response regulator
VTPLPRLTLRKVTILLHLEAGCPYKQIAEDLGVHINTVHLHVRQMADDLPKRRGLDNRDLVLLYLDRLLEANADVVANVRRNDHAA